MSLLPLPENNHDNDPFDFAGSVGRNADNNRDDVIKAQILLADAGEFDLPAPGMPTGWPGDGLTRAIRNVQKAGGLPVDGLMLPLQNGAVGANGEGETLFALKDLLDGRRRERAIPTAQQVDRFFETYARDPEAQSDYRTLEKRAGDPTPVLQSMEIRRPQPELPLQPLSTNMGDAAPPAPGQQEAALPAALALPYLLGAGVLGLGAGEYLRRQHEKNRTQTSDPPPFRPFDDVEKGQTTTPPLQPPEVDASLQGRPAADRQPAAERLIPPDTTEWISGLPPAQQPLAEGLAGIIVEAHQFGPRGKPETQLATRIVTKVCFDQLQKRPDLVGKLFHVAGSQDEKGEPLTEEWVPRQNANNLQGGEKLKSGVHVDSSFGPSMKEEDKGSPYWARMQTVDFSKRADEHDPEGRYKREKDADNRLLENMRTGVAEWARKMRPGETVAEYAAYAKIRCDRMWDKLEAQLRRDGALPAR